MRASTHHDLADLLRKRCIDRRPWYRLLAPEALAASTEQARVDHPRDGAKPASVRRTAP